MTVDTASRPARLTEAEGPRHALSFDLEAVHVMEREGRHWAWRGAARYDSADLAGRLAALRRSVEGLRAANGPVALIIPDDQVLFTDLEVDPALPRREAVAQSLDGMTPYAVEELDFDWVDDVPGRVKVAAIWRETLSEARAFATHHGFTPVAALADPEASHFPRPARFDLGPPVEAKGEEVPANDGPGSVFEAADAPFDGSAPDDDGLALGLDAPDDAGRGVPAPAPDSTELGKPAAPVDNIAPGGPVAGAAGADDQGAADAPQDGATASADAPKTMPDPPLSDVDTSGLAASAAAPSEPSGGPEIVAAPGGSEPQGAAGQADSPPAPPVVAAAPSVGVNAAQAWPSEEFGEALTSVEVSDLTPPRSTPVATAAADAGAADALTLDQDAATGKDAGSASGAAEQVAAGPAVAGAARPREASVTVKVRGPSAGAAAGRAAAAPHLEGELTAPTRGVAPTNAWWSVVLGRLGASSSAEPAGDPADATRPGRAAFVLDDQEGERPIHTEAGQVGTPVPNAAPMQPSPRRPPPSPVAARPPVPTTAAGTVAKGRAADGLPVGGDPGRTPGETIVVTATVSPAASLDPRARAFHDRVERTRQAEAAAPDATRIAARPRRSPIRHAAGRDGFYVMLGLLILALAVALIVVPGGSPSSIGVASTSPEPAPDSPVTGALQPSPPEAAADAPAAMADAPAATLEAPAATLPEAGSAVATPQAAPASGDDSATAAAGLPTPPAAALPAQADTAVAVPAARQPAPVSARAPVSSPAPAPASADGSASGTVSSPLAVPRQAPVTTSAAVAPPVVPPVSAPIPATGSAEPDPTGAAPSAVRAAPPAGRAQAIDAAVARAVTDDPARAISAARPARAPEGRNPPQAPARPTSADTAPAIPRSPLPAGRATEAEPARVTGMRPRARPDAAPSAPAVSNPAPTAVPAAPALAPASASPVRPRLRPDAAPPDRTGDASGLTGPLDRTAGTRNVADTGLALAATAARRHPEAAPAPGTPAPTRGIAVAALGSGAEAWGGDALLPLMAAMPAVDRAPVRIGTALNLRPAAGGLVAAGTRVAQARPPQRSDAAPAGNAPSATVVPPRRTRPGAQPPAAQPPAAQPPAAQGSAVEGALAEASRSLPSGGATSARPRGRPGVAAAGGARAVDDAIAAAIDESPARPGGVPLTALTSSSIPARAPRSGRTAPQAGAADTGAVTAAVAAAAAAGPALAADTPRAGPAPDAPDAAASAAEEAARAERLRLDDALQRQAEDRIRARAAADAKVEAQQRAQAEARARAQAEAEARAAASRRQPVVPSESDNEPEIAGPVGGGTSNGTVSSNATLNGLDLRRTTLIGVVGAGPASRGLIRLRNGRIVTVRLGDRIDGGPITSIADSAVTYVKGGRPYQLKMLDGR